VRPVQISPGLTVTLKPYKGSRPILVLRKEFEEKDSYLFKLQKSRLEIRDMNVVIESKSNFSAVQMGEAHLVFDRCIVELRAGDTADLSVVTFLEVDRMMKMDGPTPEPSRVEFHDCFIRGKGDLIALRGCRKLSVEVTKSLVAVKGSLLDIRAASKPMPMSEGVTWKMDKSSVFTTESIFALRAEADTVLTKTHAKFRDCLLASLVPDQPLVLLQTPREEKMKDYLVWDCDQNFYANFEMAKVREWQDQFKEPASKYESLMISPKLNLAELWKATPDWFRPTDPEQQDRISNFGMQPEWEKSFVPPPLKTDEP
jgi:hypothetical protein